MNIRVPIPFLGWWIEDEEDAQQMLRDQIHIQQHRIKELEAEVMMLQQECSSLIKQSGEVK
jgi:cell division protein FtsB